MKWGLIGFGKMGKIRHEVLTKLGEPVTHIYDPACQKMEKGQPGRLVGCVDEILEDPSIDAVIISTPNVYTCEYVCRSLQAGKHVFAEKPPGINAAEVNVMREMEKRCPRQTLMFGFNHRHHKSILKAKEIVDSKELGDILWMRGRYGKSVPPDFANNWRSKKALAGGGILLDQGIHMLDLFLFMVGDLSDVKAEVSNVYWQSDIEDNVFAIYTNPKGQVASLHSTMTQWRHLFSFELFLQKGHIIINGLLTSSRSYGEEQLTVAKNVSVDGYSISRPVEEKFTYTIDDSWKSELNMFINAVECNHPVRLGHSDDALKLMKLIDKTYECR